MKKILWYSDSPTVTTGFGNVAHQILKQLAPFAEIKVVGINGDGHPYDIFEHDYDIVPAFSFHPLNNDGDIYGRNKLLHYLETEDYDYIITLQDTFVLQELGVKIKAIQARKAKEGKPFKWVLYYPADMPLHPEWIQRSIMMADIAVSYNQYGIDTVLDQQKNVPEIGLMKDKLKVIYHGTDTKSFFPVSEQAKDMFRESYFHGKVKKDDFLIINVNRNQSRKDLTRTLITFKYILEEIPNAKLYTHCLVEGDAAGENLFEVARRIGLDNHPTVWLYPTKEMATPGMGMGINEMNMLYNVADVNFSTSMGEGWGLSSTEAMMAGTINVLPRHTSFPEIVGRNEERGYLMNAGNSPSLWMSFGKFDNSVVRPLTDVESAIQKLKYVYQHKDLVKQKIEAARKWAIETLDWDVIGRQWRDLLEL